MGLTMRIFIANTTKQIVDLAFRLPEREQIVYRKIQPGSQICAHDGTSSDIDAIIQQLEPYGMKEARKIDQAKVHIGLCYNIDAAVKQDFIEKALRDNDDHLNRAAHERRKASVAAMSEHMNQTSGDTGFTGELEIEAIQQVPLGQEIDSPVAENLAVSTTGRKSRSRK